MAVLVADRAVLVVSVMFTSHSETDTPLALTRLR
jgi:hypothetical protein